MDTFKLKLKMKGMKGILRGILEDINFEGKYSVVFLQTNTFNATSPKRGDTKHHSKAQTGKRKHI
jgi:hypothetical protein